MTGTLREQIVITAKDRTAEAFGSVNKRANSIAKTFGIASLSVGGLSTALFLNVRRSAEAARELDNLARISGTGVEEFQRIAIAANRFGVEQEKVGDILKDVRDRIGDFIVTGGGPLVDFFERVAPAAGVTAEQFRGLSGAQGLQLYVDSLEKANVSQNEMIFFLEAVSSDLTQLAPLLSDGGKLLKEMGDNAEDAGRVMSQFDVATLLSADETIRQLDGTFKAFATRLAVKFAPAINAVIKRLSEMAGIDFKESPLSEMLTDIQIADKAVQKLQDKIAGFGPDGEIFMNGQQVDRASKEYLKSLDDQLAAAKAHAVEMRKIYNAEVAKTANFGDIGSSSSARSGGLDPIQRARETAEKQLQAVRDALLSEEDAIRASYERRGQIITETRAQFPDLISEDSAEALQAKLDAQADLEVTALQQREADKLAALQQAFATKAEAEDLEFERQLARIEQSKLTEQDKKAAIEEIEKRHQDNLVKLVKDGEASREQVQKLGAKAKQQIAVSSAGTLLGVLAQHNKKFFKLFKAATIAEGLVSIAGGVVKALNLPYPANLAAAASVAVEGATLMSKLKSIGPNSTGNGVSGPSSSAAASSTPISSSSISASGPVSNDTERDIRTVVEARINIQGDFINSRDFAEKANEALRDLYNDNGAPPVIFEAAS